MMGVHGTPHRDGRSKVASTLKAAALASGDVDEATYDKVVDPKGMFGQGYAGA